MRGIVNLALNERRRPGVNTEVSAFYENGDVVEIVDSVFGDTIEGEDRWYKLSTGNFVWSGAVDVCVDCSFLPDDQRDHYLISYRQILQDGTGRPNLNTKEPSKILYATPVRLPADTESIRTNILVPENFTEALMQAVNKLNSKRKHVFVYIHGYQLFSSLKLDLLSSFVLNYMTHPENSIAKVLFLAWPGQGGPSRETVDDRSVRAGQQFTENNLWEIFKQLSSRLTAEGKTLNLLVHSFGHQLLNGMLNPDNNVGNIPDTTIFRNIFLMAPDITHLTAQNKGGTPINNFKDANGKDYHYEFSKLQDLANRVHVFHDKYDYLLYASTKKFVEKGELNSALTADERLCITRDYRNLGNHAFSKIDPQYNVITRFEYHDVETIVAEGTAGDQIDYPFRGLRPATREMIDDIWNFSDYRKVNIARILFNAQRFPDHHRYLYTCKPVVDKVLELLKQ
jgi:hypothetical protein